MRRILWADPEPAEAAVERLLADPGRALELSGARFVKNHLRTAVAELRVGDRRLFVKRYHPYRWYRRVEGAFLGTPARRAFEAARALEAEGFRVPRVLAVVEEWRYGLPAESYFVTEAVEDGVPAGRFWVESARGLEARARRAVLRAVTETLRRFHDAGFYTRDANANNFLVRGNAELGFELVHLDLDGVRRLRVVRESRRVKNLVQLYRLVRGQMSRGDRWRALLAYFGDAIEARHRLPELDRVDRAKEAEYQRRWGAERREARP